MFDNSQYVEYLKSDKWRKIALKRLEIDQGVCQCCGSRGTVGNGLQCHHISYRHLYHEENYIFEDLVILCAACHKNLHRIMNRVTNADGRKGWGSRHDIPLVFTFNLSGEEERMIGGMNYERCEKS